MGVVEVSSSYCSCSTSSYCNSRVEVVEIVAILVTVVVVQVVTLVVEWE